MPSASAYILNAQNHLSHSFRNEISIVSHSNGLMMLSHIFLLFIPWGYTKFVKKKVLEYIYFDQGDKLSRYSHVRPSVGPLVRPCEHGRW